MIEIFCSQEPKNCEAETAVLFMTASKLPTTHLIVTKPTSHGTNPYNKNGENWNCSLLRDSAAHGLYVSDNSVTDFPTLPPAFCGEE